MTVSPAPTGHIFLSCGEASGDRYGAALTAALRSLVPEIRISALGGPDMARAGAELIADSAELAIMGFSEVVASLPTLLKVRRRIWRHLDDQGVDLVNWPPEPRSRAYPFFGSLLLRFGPGAHGEFPDFGGK